MDDDLIDEPLGGGGIGERVDEFLAAWDVHRTRPIAMVGVVLAGLALVALSLLLRGGDDERRPVEDLIPRVALEATQPPTRQSSIVVHVAGAVQRPGVYELHADARVLDALAAAGGPVADADPQQLNLAAPVIDGVRIVVPLVGEIAEPIEGMTSEGSGPVDLNRASGSQLEQLSGVGPATAAAIVSYRDEHGPFRSVEDLLGVRGIGPSKLDGFREQVVVTGG